MNKNKKMKQKEAEKQNEGGEKLKQHKPKPEY